MTNPLSTPYNQILSWLCQRKDYSTAAGVALSLLNDVEAVYELRGVPEETNQELIAHQGLLDGISPLASGDATRELKTLTSLADMTVGCLIKGGVSMSNTLEGFLSRNTLYDSARASLMLVGTIALTITSEPTHIPQIHGNIVDCLSKAESPSENVLWPVRSLLKMAVARNCLSSALLLLNSAIPNELRWRKPQVPGIDSGPRPSLGLFLAIIDIILESTTNATRVLLDLFDEESGHFYWFSIDDDTRLALCLFSVNGRHVLIQEPEVRAWIVEQLKGAIDPLNNGTCSGCQLPDGWLREIITGAFCNADCDICLGLDSTRQSSTTHIDEDLACYRQEMVSVQDLLVPQDGSGGLDFDILIPCLLLLSTRHKTWREGSSISTQVLLNTLCDLAGRKTLCLPRFLFDGRTVMRQCALAENIQAAAFLVGGRSGLILECADLLITKLGITMKEAEIALFGGAISELKEFAIKWDKRRCGDSSISSLAWSPSESQRHVLWLIEHHIINVSTYGDFDSATNGRMTPVTAGRIW